MNDFVARLERELVEAARRRQAPRRRLLAGLAPWSRRFAAALTAAALVAIVVAAIPGPRNDERTQRANPAPTGPVPRELLGSYVARRGGVTLILDTRRYTLLLANQPALTGAARMRGSELVLGNDGNGPCGTTDRPATYRLITGGARLRLRRVTDPCHARARALRLTLSRGG